jgi:hypothetical protein
MRDYKDVNLQHVDDKPFDLIPRDYTPVAIEMIQGAELLPQFDHPKKAVYVFGPEDGGLNRMHLGFCHRFVRIPSNHCVNLSAAVYLTLYDRLAKTDVNGWPYSTSLDLLDNDTWLMNELDLSGR